MIKRRYLPLCLLFPLIVADLVSAEFTIETKSGKWQHQACERLPDGAFVVEGSVDPSSEPGGDLQAVASVLLGWRSESIPAPRSTEVPSIAFEVREGNGIGSWEVWIDGVNETARQPNPKPASWAWDGQNQLPNQFTQRDGSYPIRIVGVPQRDGATLLRFYFQHLDRPVAEHFVRHPLAGTKVFAITVLGGNSDAENSASFDLHSKSIPSKEANSDWTPREAVLRALDLSRPELKPIADALEKDAMDLAGRLLLGHFRTRSSPKGPSWDEVKDVVLHPDYAKVANETLKGSYGTVGWFSQFATHWKDANGKTHQWVNPDGTLNWARDNGHFNRHFHWCALAKAWEESRDARYARQFSHEVHDWVTREPFFWDECPQVGKINTMDGTVFRKGYMNTSNIGRRCELTWWPAYEVFRKTDEFTDDAHFAMLLGFLRQSRLLMNPTAFAAHDDGGAHGSIALLQNGLMLPEFKESIAWKDEALRRWDVVLDTQFYADGSHVSGSTGYNWASIHALQNFIRLMRRTDAAVPTKLTETLEKALMHPIGISRPDQGQIDMNDGGWGMVDSHFGVVVDEFLPDNKVFEWMASKGEAGSAPEFKSIQYPHSGHLVQRTGWGQDHKYLFMDAGPVGASHGRNDKLNLYFAIGPHQLISSGGRGSYDANPFSRYAGSTYGYNTVIVDDLPQQRLHIKQTHTGYQPEPRRWIESARFDFAEGFYRAGWFGPTKHIQGTHTRELIMVKGTNPPKTTYWVVIDTVETGDEEEHELKALFHSRRDVAEIDPRTMAFTCIDRGSGFRILPGTAEGLRVRNTRGQTSPYLQGWHVVGTRKAPMHTAEYAWFATERSTRAWILESSTLPAEWSVNRCSCKEEEDSIVLSIHHNDGSSDLIRRTHGSGGSHVEVTTTDVDGEVAVTFDVE